MAERTARLPLWARMCTPLVVVVVALVIGSLAEPRLDAARSGWPPLRPWCAAPRAPTSRWPSPRRARHWPCATRSPAAWPPGGPRPRSSRPWWRSTARPSCSSHPLGGFSLIWIVPIVLGLGAVTVVAVFFWRRSRQFDSFALSRPSRPREPGRPDLGSGGDHNERWFLNDEREFLRRSLDDAQREHSAGDLSNADYVVLVGATGAGSRRSRPSSRRWGPRRTRSPYAMARPRRRCRPARPRREWRRVGIIGCCFLIARWCGHPGHPRRCRAPRRANPSPAASAFPSSS